eukprot:302538_1
MNTHHFAPLIPSDTRRFRALQQPDYSAWSHKSKYQMIEISTTNMLKRLRQIISIVNEETSKCSSSPLMSFTLSEKTTQQMLIDVKNGILCWKGVDVSFCLKQKSTFDEYNKTSMNWFNRNKAKLYGNHFFYPLVFIHILNFCNTLDATATKINLYLNILIRILTAKIRFPRTKEQPLLPNQTLMQPNKFKSAFVQYLSHFDIHHKPTHRDSLKCGKKRSNAISKSFVNSLYEIKNKMMDQNHQRFQHTRPSESGTEFRVEPTSDQDEWKQSSANQVHNQTDGGDGGRKPLCSVLVPIDDSVIEYQFLSFDPLFIKQNRLSLFISHSQ